MVIQVKHQPRKQVIINEMAIYSSAQQFVDAMTIGMPPGAVPAPLKWANGILLTFTALPANTDFLAKERANGTLYWDHVSFASLPKFTPQIVSQNNIQIDLADVSNNETFQAISKFLKTKLKKK